MLVIHSYNNKRSSSLGCASSTVSDEKKCRLDRVTFRRAADARVRVTVAAAATGLSGAHRRRGKVWRPPAAGPASPAEPAAARVPLLLSACCGPGGRSFCCFFFPSRFSVPVGILVVYVYKLSRPRGRPDPAAERRVCSLPYTGFWRPQFKFFCSPFWFLKILVFKFYSWCKRPITVQVGALDLILLLA